MNFYWPACARHVRPKRRTHPTIMEQSLGIPHLSLPPQHLTVVGKDNTCLLAPTNGHSHSHSHSNSLSFLPKCPSSTKEGRNGGHFQLRSTGTAKTERSATWISKQQSYKGVPYKWRPERSYKWHSTAGLLPRENGYRSSHFILST
jgi:hypothetical protein